MERVLAGLVDYEAVRRIENSEEPNPGKTLGAHLVKAGLLIQAYIPGAKMISVQMEEKSYPMDRIGGSGFFAALFAGVCEMRPYRFWAEYENGDAEVIDDPYSYRFQTLFTEEELRKFEAGIYYHSYEKMGAHPVTEDGVEGVHFAVWAPEALRVSVTGDFNAWDGRRHPMEKLGDSGIYEIFIPGLCVGDKYKYEIKTQKKEPMLKADPWGFYAELRPATASVVWDAGAYRWNDGAWMEKRKTANLKKQPVSVYEVHLGSWMQKPDAMGADGNPINGSRFYNYRELALKLAAYVKEMGYTHVELLPVMEHPLDASWGYQVTGYYAPTSRFGTPDDFKAFVDHMHHEGIGVILDWVPAHFPRDAHGLAAFDGTCVYEHRDPRQGLQQELGMLVYNYGRPQVSNFLISSALFWAREYHADGIRMDSVETMLYLDYGKHTGEWIANIYGGHENLEAVEFLKHLSSIFHKEGEGAVLIAEESAAWPQITGSLREGGLGFDFKWNVGWMNDFLRYMQETPDNRHEHYGDLTFGMLYAYSEKFMLIFSHDEVVHGKGSMAGKMPGSTPEEKMANLRAAYGFMTGHPGKKLLFMGQDSGQMDEWHEDRGLDWEEIAGSPVRSAMKEYVKALNRMYRSEPALYEEDFTPEGFEWINCVYDRENIVIFARKSEKREETLLFVCNFAPASREGFRLGVPHEGTYTEILNSDSRQFGGRGMTNPGEIKSERMEKDNRENSIVINLAPFGTCVFRYMPEKADEAGQKRGNRLDVSEAEPGKKSPGTLDLLSERVGRLIRKAGK